MHTYHSENDKDMHTYHSEKDRQRHTLTHQREKETKTVKRHTTIKMCVKSARIQGRSNCLFKSLSRDVWGYVDSVWILKGTRTPQLEVAGYNKHSSSVSSGAE